MQKKLIPFYHTEEGKKWFNHFLNTNVRMEVGTDVQARIFPDYMEELHGLAEGSNTPFYELFLNMLQEEFSYVVPPQFSYTPATHCSDYILRSEDDSIIVHNEDGSGMIDFNKTIIVEEKLYISASFSITSLVDNKLVSNYTAFTYAAQIPTAGDLVRHV